MVGYYSSPWASLTLLYSLKCPVVAHWRCLAATQRDEILKAARDKDQEEWKRSLTEAEAKGIETAREAPGKRPGLDTYQTTEFICGKGLKVFRFLVNAAYVPICIGACMKGGVCMGCMEVAIEPDAANSSLAEGKASDGEQSGDVTMSDSVRVDSKTSPPNESIVTASHSDQILLFRCFTCKRVAHYQHLPLPPTLPSDGNLDDIVQFYSRTWLCADCSSYRDGVDKIIAWRPYPPNAVEPPRQLDEAPNYKSPLPREYLVKWLDRSYRRLQWVPHMWLVSTHQAKLKNFLTGGSKVELLRVVEEEKRDATLVFEISNNSRASSAKPGTATPFSPLEANPDAERRIPRAWKTVDRVLDVRLWHPKQRPKGTTRKGKRNVNTDMSSDEVEEAAESIEGERTLAFERGEQPSVNFMESVLEWETRTRDTFTLENTSQVVWAFIKWDELGYDEGRPVNF